MFPARSFFFSLLLGNLLQIGVILSIGLTSIYYEINRHSLLLTDQFLEQLLAMVQNDLQNSWPHVEEHIDLYCNHNFRERGVRLTIVDIQGRVLGDSGFPSEKMEPHLTLDRPEMIAAVKGEHGKDIRTSKTTYIKYRFLAEPIIKDGQTVAVVRVARPISEILESRRMLFQGASLILVYMLLTATLLSLLLSWLLYKPLRILVDEARCIAKGDLTPSSIMEGPREMMQLSQSLDAMRQTFSGQLETITRQRESLQTILCHLPDAIFALNHAAEVIYFNAAAKELFRIESAAERPYLQEVIRNAAIVEWYLDCRKQMAKNHLAGTPVSPLIASKEVDLFSRKYFLELEFVETGSATKGVGTDDAACLLIVSNLTECVLANKMKTDFVANASHELRTPLAAIQAALDNVSEEVYDDRATLKKIIQVVDRHVLRLNALIEDLLALNSMEDETMSGRLDETNIAEQQSWIEELFRRRIDEKHINFVFASDCGDTPFRVDNKRLGLILQNLIDNAVKFTPEGGEIMLYFRREEALLIIECRDTGFGIAVEEQQRIFERFYQGDSSKTGDGRVRGTGLGLAIVKHAVERLKGSITLESRIAQGSVFTVRIPVDRQL